MNNIQALKKWLLPNVYLKRSANRHPYYIKLLYFCSAAKILAIICNKATSVVSYYAKCYHWSVRKTGVISTAYKKRYWTVGFLLQEVFTSTSLICFGMFRQPFPVQMLHGHTPSTALSAPVMDVQRWFWASGSTPHNVVPPPQHHPKVASIIILILKIDARNRHWQQNWSKHPAEKKTFWKQMFKNISICNSLSL